MIRFLLSTPTQERMTEQLRRELPESEHGFLTQEFYERSAHRILTATHR